MAIIDKLRPLIAKIRGKAPFCPWRSTLSLLDPRLLRVYPPKLDIKEVGREDGLVCYRFSNKHDFWFPEQTSITPELWSEYLVVFWDHVKNFHNYVRGLTGLSSADVVYDCGACEGFFTRFALENGVRQVISIEPSMQMARALARTFRGDIEDSRARIQNVALSSISARAHFVFDESNTFGGRLDKNGTSEVKVTTIDVLSQELVVPTFIKMDLEGYELEALRGGERLFTKHKPFLAVTTYHNSVDYSLIARQIKSYGYKHTKANGVSLRTDGCPRPVLMLAS